MHRKVRDYIKRVIALPGENVKVKGDKVYINGQEIDQPYIQEAIEQALKKDMPYNNVNRFSRNRIVPEGEIFAMGITVRTPKIAERLASCALQ